MSLIDPLSKRDKRGRPFIYWDLSLPVPGGASSRHRPLGRPQRTTASCPAHAPAATSTANTGKGLLTRLSARGGLPPSTLRHTSARRRPDGMHCKERHRSPRRPGEKRDEVHGERVEQHRPGLKTNRRADGEHREVKQNRAAFNRRGVEHARAFGCGAWAPAGDRPVRRRGGVRKILPAPVAAAGVSLFPGAGSFSTATGPA